MEQTKSTWFTELSFFMVLPTILYVLFASSAVWAAGNPLWTNFYSFFSAADRVQTFNFWAAIIFVGGTFAAFLFALASLGINIIKEEETEVKINVLNLGLTLLTGSILASLILFFLGVNVYTTILH
jgi:hypothetical protein